MAEPEDEPPPVLLPCSVCSRTFKPESLQKHLKVCAKQASKKRKVFDSSKQRIQGTELAEFLPKILREKKTEKVVPKKPESNWKEKHLEFVAAIRAARGVEPVSTKSSSTVSKSSNEKCPHCDRNFGPKAFDRHIEWCKEQKARIPKSPASLIQAKERLEARTKYRAPPLAKSKRTLTREKYARVSQHSSKDSSPLGSRSAVAFSKPQPQEVKVPETTSRIPGIRNKPKLSSSSPSCTLPSGNTQVKRREPSPSPSKRPFRSGNTQVKKREPSPSPSKRPFRSGSKTVRKGPMKAKNDDTNTHASLFTSSCNITKIQPTEERHKAREVKPNPVESRVIARKSSLKVPKPHKRKGDPATNPMGVGAHSSTGNAKTSELPFSADGIELHENTISCDTHNSLLGESLQVKGTPTQPSDEEDCASSDNVKRFRTHGTKQHRIKVNDIDVNKKNDGLFVSPCSIFQSNCNLVVGKDSTKSKQGLKGRNSDLENEECNITVTPYCVDDDVQTEKLMKKSVKEKIVFENHSKGRCLKTDCHEDELTKFCVDSPNYGSGDAICQRVVELQKRNLSSDLPMASLDKDSVNHCVTKNKCEEFSPNINKSFNAQENTCCSFIGDGEKTKTKNQHSVISESFLSAKEVNDQINFQQNIDYQSYHIDPLCFQEIKERRHNELSEIKERREEKVVNEDFETCEDHCLQIDSDDIQIEKLSANEGRGLLASSQTNLFQSDVDNSTCLKDKGVLTLGNEKERKYLSNEEEHCVPVQKFPYSFDLDKNIDCKIGLAGNLGAEAHRECSFVSACNECSNEFVINSNEIYIETVDEMGDIQNSQVHYVKERLSENLKAFDLIFSSSECESSEKTIAKFNKKNTSLNNVDMTYPIEHNMKNSTIVVKSPDTSIWENHECSDILQDSLLRSDLKSECPEFSHNLSVPCDLNDLSYILMRNNQVSPENVKKELETLKGEAVSQHVCNTVCPETLKERLNSCESMLTISFPDTTAVSFDTESHLSLLTGGETQMNVSRTSVIVRAIDEPNNIKTNSFVNNSFNCESELNFSHTTNNTSTINVQDLSGSSLPDVLLSFKDKNSVKNCSLVEGFERKDFGQQNLKGKDSCIEEQGEFCVSLHGDDSMKNDYQFSGEYESVLLKDSNYDERNSIPCCQEKDRIQSKVCNMWSSCEEEEPELFYQYDLPENLIYDRFIDSPTDRIWDLASQEFIKNVRKDSCNIDSNLNIPIESYSSGDYSGNTEEIKELSEQQKMLWFNSYKRKNIQFKAFSICSSILFRGFSAFLQHRRQRKYLKKKRSSTMNRMKKKYRTFHKSIKKPYNLEEPSLKKRFFHQLSVHCEALSDICSEQNGEFRNTMENYSVFNLNNSIQGEQRKFSISNSRVIDFDQNSDNVYKNMIKSSESIMGASSVDDSKNKTVFTFQNCNHLHCNSEEENENCTLKTKSSNIVAVEALKKAENQEVFDEALPVVLSLRKEYEAVPESINLQMITSQNQNIFKCAFDVMKFYLMSELLCSGALYCNISKYIHRLSSTQYRNKKQCLGLPILPILDKTQNNDLDLKLGSSIKNVPSTVNVFYDIDESLFKENLFSAYVVSHKMNEKYFSSEYESASLIENQFLEIDHLAMNNCKDNNELSLGIKKEEYKEKQKNSSSGKSNPNLEIENVSNNKEMNAELNSDLKSQITDWEATVKNYQFEYEISKHSLSQMFESRLQHFCEPTDTDSSGSQSFEVYELPTETLLPQQFSYERDEDISYDLFPEILGGFETPQVRNCLNRNVGCKCSQEFVDGLEFDFIHDSRDISRFAFECVENNTLLELYPFYSGSASYHSNGVVIKELSEESEEQLLDVDLHPDEDNCNTVITCVSEFDKTGFTGSLNASFAEEKDCLYNLNSFNESKEGFVETNLPEWIEETDYAQTNETHDSQNVELNSSHVLLTPGTSCCTSDLAIANVCYHPCKLDILIPQYNRNIFCINFPSFLYNENNDFDVKVWASNITIPQKKVFLVTHSFQSPTKKSYGAEGEEGSKKIDFHERLAQNIRVMQQNSDSLFEGISKRMQEDDIDIPKRKTSALIFKEAKQSTSEKQINHPLTSGTNMLRNEAHGDNVSLYDLAMNVKGVIQSERSKLSEVQTHKKHKIKSAKEHDMSLLKLVEKWSTKEKVLKRPKTYEITNKKANVQTKQEVPKIYRLPPLSNPPKCCLQNSSSSEEVYDPYVSAERQMMELLSQGDFTQLSPRHNKSILSSHTESTAVFPSFESSHRSAFVRYSPDLSHLSNETVIPPSLIAEFEDLFMGSQKSNYINDISDVTDQQNQNIHISLSDIGQNLSNNNLDTVQPVRKPSKIRAKMENAALSLQRSVSLMNYENDMKVGTEASSLIPSDGDNNPLPTLTEISSFPFSSPEPPRVFSSSKSHLEKGDADKRINEEAFMLKSESSISNELFTQLKSHSACGKFSADSAYGSLNRRSPTHSTGMQMPGKHEEMEGDRMCFMSSSSSESSLPPLCSVQVVKREASNPSLSPSPPHAVDASPVLQSAPRMSKFCHECGSKYPVSLAKFCCECGVRRLAM